jgi:hypothetical protein
MIPPGPRYCACQERRSDYKQRKTKVPEAFVPYAITGFFNCGLLIRTAQDPNLLVLPAPARPLTSGQR